MRLTFHRRTAANWGERLEFNGWLDETRQDFGGKTYDYIEVGFSTDKPLGKGWFTATIRAADFEALAKEMVKTDPEASVKAFGAALQDVHAVRPPKPSPVAKSINVTA